MRNGELNAIWIVGKSAAMNGYTIEDCPYRTGPRRRAWLMGFTAGKAAGDKAGRPNNSP